MAKMTIKEAIIIALKYILINAGFILVGIFLSVNVNIASWFNLYHAHDMGFSNLFLTTPLFTILGFAFTAYLFFRYKILFAISVLAIIIISGFLIWMFG